MPDNYKDIFSHLPANLDQETMLLYLQGKLSPEERHEVEKQLIDNDFDGDALEGLQEFHDKQELQFLVESLNRDLRRRTDKKKKAREKMRIKDQPWLYISILILILLIVLSYIVLHRMMNR
jgi:hypothetical protein